MESHYIDASNETLQRQASLQAEDYMRNAIAAIDQQFGKDTAAKSPALVAAFMHAAATDYQANIIARSLGQLGEALNGAIDSLGTALGSRP